MEKVHGFLRRQAIKFGVFGTIVVAVLLIFGPLLDLLLPQHPDIVMGVSIAILTGVGLLLLDYFSEIKRLIKPAEIRLYTDQQAADNDLRAFIDSTKPTEADLLECSSGTVYSTVIKPLIRAKSQIRLLILNPKRASEIFEPSNRQERRICNQFALHMGSDPEVARYDKIRIRYYRELPSLRGRKFENNLINVGWFTYDSRPEEMEVSTDPLHIWGHSNPLLTIAATHENFYIVEGFFSKVFKNLWNRGSLPKDICNACPEKQSKRCPVSDDWLERVSRA